MIPLILSATVIAALVAYYGPTPFYHLSVLLTIIGTGFLLGYFCHEVQPHAD